MACVIRLFAVSLSTSASFADVDQFSVKNHRGMRSAFTTVAARTLILLSRAVSSAAFAFDIRILGRSGPLDFFEAPRSINSAAPVCFSQSSILHCVFASRTSASSPFSSSSAGMPISILPA